jgi:hypothetical protein
VIADGGLSHSQSLVPFLLLLLRKKKKTGDKNLVLEPALWPLVWPISVGSVIHTHSPPSSKRAPAQQQAPATEANLISNTHSHAHNRTARRAAVATGGASRDVHATESGVLKVPHELWPRGHTSRLDLGPHRDLVVPADATHTDTHVFVCDHVSISKALSYSHQNGKECNAPQPRQSRWLTRLAGRAGIRPRYKKL